MTNYRVIVTLDLPDNYPVPPLEDGIYLTTGVVAWVATVVLALGDYERQPSWFEAPAWRRTPAKTRTEFLEVVPLFCRGVMLGVYSVQNAWEIAEYFGVPEEMVRVQPTLI